MKTLTKSREAQSGNQGAGACVGASTFSEDSRPQLLPVPSHLPPKVNTRSTFFRKSSLAARSHTLPRHTLASPLAVRATRDATCALLLVLAPLPTLHREVTQRNPRCYSK
jgi:hypothetical protein